MLLQGRRRLRKGQIQPCQSPDITKDHGTRIDIGNTRNEGFFFIIVVVIGWCGLVDPTFGDAESLKDSFDRWNEEDLNDRIAASKGIKDLDDSINLQQTEKRGSYDDDEVKK